MANSTSNIPGIVVGSQSKEQQANALFDAASQAMTYGRNAATSSGLTWGYLGGNVVVSSGARAEIANGTLTLTASQTNYIVAAKADGTVSFATNTTNWDNDSDYWRLYSVVTGAATVTSWVDHRCPGQYQGAGSGGGGGGGTVDTIVAGDGIIVDATDPANPEVSADFGSTAGTVCEGDDARLSDSRDWNGTGVDDAAAGRTALSVREILISNRTYYVRTDGSDSNNGLADTTGGAFLTLQKAIDTAAALDLSIYSVTINVDDRTIADTVVLKNFDGSGSIEIIGNPTTPGNVLISPAAGSAIVGDDIGRWNISGVRIEAATGVGIEISGRLSFLRFGDVEIGECGFYHAFLTQGARGMLIGPLLVDGGAQNGLWASRQGLLFLSGQEITFGTGVTYAGSFLRATEQSWVDAFGITFVGSFTGQRYYAEGVSGIFVNGAGGTYVPGTVAGALNNGGVYY